MERYADKLKDGALRDLLGCVQKKIEGGGEYTGRKTST